MWGIKLNVRQTFLEFYFKLKNNKEKMIMKEINKKWDKILNDLGWEKFDLEFFQVTMKESFNVIYKKSKRRNDRY